MIYTIQENLIELLILYFNNHYRFVQDKSKGLLFLLLLLLLYLLLRIEIKFTICPTLKIHVTPVR